MTQNQSETEQAQKLLAIIRGSQPQFSVAADAISIRTPNGETLSIPLSQRTTIAEDIITNR